MVGDRIWPAARGSPEKLALNQILYADFTALSVARGAEDERLTASSTASTSTVRSAAGLSQYPGERFAPPGVLGHLFNHQTHHRGQVHVCCRRPMTRRSST
jgi:uncharacterized damage-inducible protein DinB